MSKFQFPINEMKRAAATAMLTVGVAIAFFGTPALFAADPDVEAVEVETTEPSLPHRPAGGRRWRSSNAEQSQATLRYYGEPDHWGRNRAALESATTLFQVGGTFSSKEIAGGTILVTLSNDSLAAYLATPFLGGNEPIAFALDSGIGRSFVVAQVLTRAVAADQLAQK